MSYQSDDLPNPGEDEDECENHAGRCWDGASDYSGIAFAWMKELDDERNAPEDTMRGG